jgi:hypothetical protein
MQVHKDQSFLSGSTQSYVILSIKCENKNLKYLIKNEGIMEVEMKLSYMKFAIACHDILKICFLPKSKMNNSVSILP